MAESWEEVTEQMRRDWNARAREDTGYYVAFGRREQSDAEFLASAGDVVRRLGNELRRICGRGASPAAGVSGLKALEIGCGPGRLMRPMARRFLELHGVDVSDEMIARAKERLGDVPNAHPHVSDGSTLAMFGEENFDFVYSYAVFQHIPSREVVFEYLKEARRVLKTGGIACFQFNGLPRTAAAPNTWSGIRIDSHDLLEFAASHDFQVLALDGASTQYLWTTWRKRDAGWFTAQQQPLEGGLPADFRVRRITNAYSSEPLATSCGRFAGISIWTENLPPDAGLHHLRVIVGNSVGTVIAIQPPDSGGIQKVAVQLPELEATGLLPVEILWRECLIAPAATIRVIPPGPSVPRIQSVTDGINLTASGVIETRLVKVTFEDLTHPEEIQASIEGHFAMDLEYFCTDPRTQRFEIDFRLPEEIGPGEHTLELHLGKRKFPHIILEVTA